MFFQAWSGQRHGHGPWCLNSSKASNLCFSSFSTKIGPWGHYVLCDVAGSSRPASAICKEHSGNRFPFHMKVEHEAMRCGWWYINSQNFLIRGKHVQMPCSPQEIHKSSAEMSRPCRLRDRRKPLVLVHQHKHLAKKTILTVRNHHHPKRSSRGPGGIETNVISILASVFSEIPKFPKTLHYLGAQETDRLQRSQPDLFAQFLHKMAVSKHRNNMKTRSLLSSAGNTSCHDENDFNFVPCFKHSLFVHNVFALWVRQSVQSRLSHFSMEDCQILELHSVSVHSLFFFCMSSQHLCTKLLVPLLKPENSNSSTSRKTDNTQGWQNQIKRSISKTEEKYDTHQIATFQFF